MNIGAELLKVYANSNTTLTFVPDPSNKKQQMKQLENKLITFIEENTYEMTGTTIDIIDGHPIPKKYKCTINYSLITDEGLIYEIKFVE